MNAKEEFLKHVVQSKKKLIDLIINNELSPFIITHHDCDGIAAAALFSLALIRKNIPFQVRVVKYLSDAFFKDVLRDPEIKKDKLFIFIDLGSGQLDFIRHNFDLDKVVIMDHHEIRNSDDSKGKGVLIHVNPWLFNIDGRRDLSSAGVVYYLAKAIDIENKNLAHLAIIGALGDEQDVGELSSLVGLNDDIVADAIKTGLIAEEVDLRIFGRFTSPIHLALSRTTQPYLPGLSGDEEGSKIFLSRINIKLLDEETRKPRKVSDLNKEEKSKLVSSIIEHSLKYGMAPSKVKSLIGKIYLLKGEHVHPEIKDMREFASLLNSCGRLDNGNVALMVAMGDRQDYFIKSQKLAKEYAKKLANYVDWVITTNALKKQDFLQVIEGGSYIDDSLVTTLTELLLNSRKVDKRFPIIAWTELKNQESDIKISARASDDLIRNGINLGQAIQETLKHLDLKIYSRGHAPAASVEIPKNKLTRFLKILNRIISKQLNLLTTKDGNNINSLF
ncbi:MAG: DHH family phosphoesterase [Promethearchaeota archaeon]